jgi:hypothetical protein
VGAAGCAVIAPLEPDLLEEGLLLHVAERLAGGEQLYRDVVVSSGPLPFEGLALLFRELGAEIALARGAVIALSALGAACAFGIARAAGAGVLAHAAGALMAAAPALLFPELGRFTASVVALHLSLAAALAALGARHSLVLAGTAGAWVTCVGLSLPSVGLALAAALSLVLVLVTPPDRRLGRVAALLCGGALAFAASATVYAARGQLGLLATSLVSALEGVSLRAWGRTISSAPAVSSLPGLHTALGAASAPGERLEIATRLLFALPVLALLTVVARRLLVGALPAAAWILAALLAAWIVHLGPHPAWSHLAPLLPLTGVVLLVVASPSSAASRAGPVAHAAAATVVGGSALAAGLASAALHAAAGPASFGPRVPLLPVSPGLQASDVSEVIGYVREHTRPGDPILVLGHEPLLYFATQTRNPTPHPGALPPLAPDEQRRLLAELEGVRLVVSSELDLSGAPAAGPPALLQRYLERTFHVPADFLGHPLPRLLVLERGADRGPVALDLVELAAAARAWIRDEAGAVRPAPRVPPALGVRAHRRPLAFVLGVAGGGLDFDVDLPEHAAFQADVGLAPLRGRRDYWHPANAVLAVSVGRDGELERLASIRLPGGHATEAPWQPLEVDLASFGPGPARLRLELEPGPGEPPSSLAWWGSPRIVSRRPELR